MRANMALLLMVLGAWPAMGFAGESTWEPMSDETVLRKIFLEKSRLKDPSSIQLRSVKYTKFQGKDGTPTTIWCGEVNAKNSYGGYVGFSPFFAHDFGGNQDVTLDSKIAHEGFVIVKDLYCKGSGL